MTDDVRWLTADEQASWRRFVAGSARLLDQLDADLKVHGLSHDDYAVLVALSEADGDRLRMSELADRVVESRSRLSHHIGRMEARGLVERTPCPEDRRGYWAGLTDAGRDAIEATAPHHVRGVRAWFLDHLDTDELAVDRRRRSERIDGRCSSGEHMLGLTHVRVGPDRG